jgi:hypothetical protein
MSEDFENRKDNPAGGKEPMNPDDIEQTAVVRDEDTEFAEDQTDTDSPEAQEQYRKKGMTEV